MGRGAGDDPSKLERYLDEARLVLDWWRQEGRLPAWVDEATPELREHKELARRQREAGKAKKRCVGPSSRALLHECALRVRVQISLVVALRMSSSREHGLVRVVGSRLMGSRRTANAWKQLWLSSCKVGQARGSTKTQRAVPSPACRRLETSVQSHGGGDR